MLLSVFSPSLMKFIQLLILSGEMEVEYITFDEDVLSSSSSLCLSS
jgi:hypothetical protein